MTECEKEFHDKIKKEFVWKDGFMHLEIKVVLALIQLRKLNAREFSFLDWGDLIYRVSDAPDTIFVFYVVKGIPVSYLRYAHKYNSRTMKNHMVLWEISTRERSKQKGYVRLLTDQLFETAKTTSSNIEIGMFTDEGRHLMKMLWHKQQNFGVYVCDYGGKPRIRKRIRYIIDFENVLGVFECCYGVGSNNELTEIYNKPIDDQGFLIYEVLKDKLKGEYPRFFEHIKFGYFKPYQGLRSYSLMSETFAR